MSLIYTASDRLFRLVELKPYTRADGTESAVAVWQTTCAECGCAVTVETGNRLTAVTTTKAFGIKHCTDHKLTPQQALARAGAARRCTEGRPPGARGTR
jgi:hypothetical protein